MKNEIFSLNDAKIFFDGQQILEHFTLHLYRQEILGIICENYTERNTLIRFFRGSCKVSGELRHLKKKLTVLPRHFFNENFYVIEGRQNLIETLSIAENICIFSDKSHLLKTKSYHEKARELLHLFQINLDLTKSVSQLTNLEFLYIELLKAYSEGKRIVVLSNISEAISRFEYLKLRQSMQNFISYGMSFIILDSIETDIFHSVDEILVVKNASSVACFESSFFHHNAFYQYLISTHKGTVSSRFSESPCEDTDSPKHPPLLLDKISAGILDKISLSFSKGKLSKLIFLDQQSLSDFRSVFFNLWSIQSGSLSLNGCLLKKDAASSSLLRRSVLWCPETPYKKAIFSNMTIRDNLMLNLADKVEHIWFKKEYTQSLDQLINQKLPEVSPSKKASFYPPEILLKVAYMRFLFASPKVLIIEQPFSEANLENREITISMISQLLAAGTSVICLFTSLSNTELMEGSCHYIKNGQQISENEAYAAFSHFPIDTTPIEE